MPKVNPHADPTRRDLGPAALGRTVKKLFSYYPVLAPVTFVCILFSSIVSSVPSLFTQNIIQIIEKWYISRDWAAAKAEIVPYLTLLVVLYALSILSMTVYTQLMAYMTQGFLHKLRCEMFGGMQKLPIRYFDSHQHGDIMSHYTNDIDTLRQLVSQALPALIQSGAIVLVVFSIMLYFSLWLTLVLVLGIIAMVAVTKKIGGGSAKYFVRQQKAVASTEGFIQEMMAGQKVVKVFCHEQKSIEDFDRLNDALFEDSFRAQGPRTHHRQHRQHPLCDARARRRRVPAHRTAERVALRQGAGHLHPCALPQHGAPVHRQRQPALPADQRGRHGGRGRTARAPSSTKSPRRTTAM